MCQKFSLGVGDLGTGNQIPNVSLGDSNVTENPESKACFRGACVLIA